MPAQEKFCCYCAAPLALKVPSGDTHPRLVCSACDHVVYHNPKILVACMAYWQDKMVWMQRAQPPQQGYWGIPAGFMEQGETPEEAAARELREETGAVVNPSKLKLFMLGSLPEISEVYLTFYGPLESPQLRQGEESLAVGLFSDAEAPWDQFAYPDVMPSVRQFYVDHAAGKYGVYSARYSEGQHVYSLVSAKP